MLINHRMNGLLLLGALAVASVLQGCVAGPAASLVLGQPDFISHAPNQGLEKPALNTMHSPQGPVVLFGGSLVITDADNSRLLVYSPVPAANNAAATSVVKLSDPAKGLDFSQPWAASVADGRLFVADMGNHRVLIWNKFPTANEVPDVVLGQPDIKTPPVDDCSHMNEPKGVFAAAGKLIVSDSLNHRILIWNAIPGTNAAPADLILGKSDCSPDDTASSRHTFRRPRGVWTDGTRLVVADTDNNRLMIWSRFPTKSTDDADIILGTGKKGPGRDQLIPYGVDSDGTRVAVTDWEHNRVLIWNHFPTKDGDLPDSVIGQGSFNRIGINGVARASDAPGIPSASTLAEPQGVTINGKQLWVTDSDNHRVLLFNLEK